MIIYLSGKITGKPLYHQKFEEAERILLKQGHTVLNPAKLPEGMPKEKYLPICFAMLDAADAIYMLRDWKNSIGANIEYNYAKYQGKEFIYE